jgi:hypothetical protein
LRAIKRCDLAPQVAQTESQVVFPLDTIAMNQKTDAKSPETRMDPTALYREEIFSDRKVGTIRQLVPVKPDATPDTSRTVVYMGQTQILTTMGALPLSFEIEAQSLEEAVNNFGQAAKVAFERTMRELEEYRRQAASSIVIPERGTGGFGPGGMPGGGNIQFP